MSRMRWCCGSGTRKACGVLVVLVVTGGIAAAAPAGGATSRPASPDLTGLTIDQLLAIDVVYGASKHEQKITEAPASVTIVTSDDIRKYGYSTLSEILSSVGGFYTTYDRDYSFIGVRGFQRPGDFNSRILILVDGHRMNDSVYESVLIGTDAIVAVGDIERVEVIRGPSSSIYGTGAFFGVINIVTRRGQGLGGMEVEGGAASYRSAAGRLAYGRQFGSGPEAFVSASGYDSGGQDLFFNQFNTPATNNGFAVNADKDRFSKAFGKFSFGDLTLEAAYSSRQKGIPTGASGTVFGDPRSKTLDDRGFIDLKYDHRFGDRVSVMSRAYYDGYYYRGDYFYLPPFNQYVEHGWAYTQGEEAQLDVRVGVRHTLMTGGEYRNHYRQDFDSQDSTGSLSLHHQAEDWGLFVQDEFVASKHVSLSAGVRRDQYPTFGGSTNPRVALILSPAERTTIKVLYGQAFRAPSVYELFYSVAANPSLTPETVRSAEVVLEQYFARTFRISASLFRNSIDNLISVNPTSGLFSNLQAVDSDGVEIGIERHWHGARFLRFDYTYQSTRDRSGGMLSDSPQNLAKLHLSLPLARERLNGGLEVLYTGRRLTLQGNALGGFAVANLNFVAMSLAKGLDVSAGIFNLLDKSYADAGSIGNAPQDAIPQDGRHFRVKLTWRF